jgi:CHAT domain-containing protein/Tfp pilus assembly protein PilF
MRTRTGSLVAIVAVLSCAFTANQIPSSAVRTADAVTRLEAGAPIEREMSGQQEHRYELALRAGEYTRVTVVQRGIDVIVRPIAPDGTVIGEFQDEPRNHGEEHVEVVAEASGNYALMVQAPLKGVAPGAYAIRIVETRTATNDDRSMQDARRLRAEYRAMFDARNYDDARPLVERALAISERVRGTDDLYVAKVEADRATVYHQKQAHARAEPLYLRALTVMEAALGTDHPTTARLWVSLADVYRHSGQRPKAERLAQRALEVSEKTLGPEHPQTAYCLLTLGTLRADAGDLDKSEELQQRALAIIEKAQSPQNFQRAVLLNNLGLLARDRHDLDRADQLFRQSLAIFETVLGTNHVDSANVLQNLGINARERRDYAQAEEYYERSLSLREKALGADHPEIAQSLTNLAIIYRAKGDIARSLETNFRALSIREKTSGPYAGGTLVLLGNIARTYAAIGDLAHAIAFQRRVDAVLETQLSLNLAVGSEREKLAFVNSVSERTDRTISLHLETASGDPEAGALAALVLLQRKGRVLDAMTDTLASLRQRTGNGDDQRLLEQLSTTTARLARLALNGPPDTPPMEHLRAIKDLEAQKEKLEAEISDRSAEFRAQSRPVTLDAVKAAIPSRTALVEFAVFRPFNPKAESNSDAYGEPHYVAYVLKQDAPPGGQDLGPAKVIDEAIGALRRALRNPKNDDVKLLARAVDEKVMHPIRGLLSDATRLLISPDGDLNLIPFEVLRDEQERYAIERYSITYLTSGRDLLRMQVPRLSKSAPVVVADPLFGEPPIADAAHPAPSSAPAGSATSIDDLSHAFFAPLAGTAQEARAIKTLFPEATVLTGDRATKSALVRVEAPRILHVATHGFFLQDAKRAIGNPLLRSGLALTGANLNPGDSDHKGAGILTALEASNLNLWGTKLVTLSACDTGVGEVKNREGVYGLRRALFLAGAETLVMSLWPVSDYVTRETMTAYYGGLKKGLGRGEALRQAQLTMLARENRRHPFYWASFIQAGEWANLDGRR